VERGFSCKAGPRRKTGRRALSGNRAGGRREAGRVVRATSCLADAGTVEGHIVSGDWSWCRGSGPPASWPGCAARAGSAAETRRGPPGCTVDLLVRMPPRPNRPEGGPAGPIRAASVRRLAARRLLVRPARSHASAPEHAFEGDPAPACRRRPALVPRKETRPTGPDRAAPASRTARPTYTIPSPPHFAKPGQGHGCVAGPSASRPRLVAEAEPCMPAGRAAPLRYLFGLEAGLAAAGSPVVLPPAPLEDRRHLAGRIARCPGGGQLPSGPPPPRPAILGAGR